PSLEREVVRALLVPGLRPEHEILTRLQLILPAELSPGQRFFVNDWLTVTNWVPPVNEPKQDLRLPKSGNQIGPPDRLLTGAKTATRGGTEKESNRKLAQGGKSCPVRRYSSWRRAASRKIVDCGTSPHRSGPAKSGRLGFPQA